MPEKVAVVTGSSAGIGRSIALAFAKKNYVVIGNARHDDDRAKSLLSELHQYSKRSTFVPGDCPARLQRLNFAVSWRAWFPK
jgi:NAD(P)-dependent dehydrogenase (short-subunit alcohol dehydrogenase family)